MRLSHKIRPCYYCEKGEEEGGGVIKSLWKRGEWNIPDTRRCIPLSLLLLLRLYSIQCNCMSCHIIVSIRLSYMNMHFDMIHKRTIEFIYLPPHSQLDNVRKSSILFTVIRIRKITFAIWMALIWDMPYLLNMPCICAMYGESKAHFATIRLYGSPYWICEMCKILSSIEMLFYL